LITLREVASVRGSGLSTKRDALMPPSRHDRRLNVRMDGPIMRALDTAAPRRYRNAQDLADALRGLFTVLGYAPSQTELTRFVAELFPNEVSVNGIGGALALTEPFEIVPFDASATFSLPEVASFNVEERASYTSAEIPAYEPATLKLPSVPEPLAPAKPAAPSFEEWDAPPGVLPEAPRLNRARVQ
ncbi:MAG: hypothetical protein ACK4N5_11510, partial [Myxococcales bacterium]